MSCHACGAENPPEMKFCTRCGAALAVRCASCDFDNPPGSKFCGSCGASLGDPLPTGAPAPSSEAERRQLTVMFCDLVGSTALSSQLDPEDMREVLRGYQETCSGVVARYDGYVAKFMGDGVYAYFGYPRAHEDDAERAINSGLGIVEAVGNLEHDLQVRIGVATGTVAVGDIVGEGASEEANVVGEAPNLAARLQEIAAPNTVVIGEATHTLAGGLFETIDLGRRDFKGFADPVGAWSVIRLRRTESRFEATHGEYLTELVGRDEELEILLRRWERAKQGVGQVVLISGEPGIGKSRLIHALRESVVRDSPYFRILQFSPHYSNSAMHAFVEQFERIMELTPEDSNAEKLDKLTSWLRLADQSPEEFAPLFGPLLGIDTADRYPAPSVSPQRQRTLLLEAVADRLNTVSATRPVLFVAEDAHWIDPTSLELLSLHAEKSRDVAVMFVFTYRPEFEAPWVGQAHTTLLVLNRLDRSLCAVLAAKVSGGADLPADVIERITERTDGVPLFVEELTKAVVEAGRHPGRAGARDAIPATLQDALEARLEGLDDARELAQIGAVIGRSFEYGLLADVSDGTEDALRGALDRLVRSELVSCRGAPPDATYSFKHALIQDAAYNSLLRGRRQQLHGRIADCLAQQETETSGVPPELLAHHFTEAGRVGPSIAHWLSAGRTSMERSADREAI